MPTIRIETLGITSGNLSVAMYHTIPSAFYSPDSEDQSRVPAGSDLTAAEVTALKEGRLIETVVSIPINGKKMVQLRGDLMEAWGSMTPSVHQQYRNDYSYTGHVWDGTWR